MQPEQPSLTSAFPPCTSETCNVDEKEKEKLANAKKSPCAMTEKCVAACSAYGRVCPCSARIAAHYACDTVQALAQNSRIFSGEPNFTYLNADDIVIGEKLGEGGFSNVNQCLVTAGDEAGQEFAVKYLKRKAMIDLHSFKHGAADLAVEAHFLDNLKHPNIVKLHGVTAGSVETNVALGKECGFFIVVDRLYDTLEKRIEKWRLENEQNGGGNLFSFLSHEYKEKKRKELMERIEIALAIADAMEYLHSKNIVYRDLKPDNIGFDKNGVVKMFDFGLAKELKPSDAMSCGRYKLTGNTGSRRYMAPEVAKDTPYNLAVDVFSFGILLWEMCSAEKPFFGYSGGKHMQQVVLGGERPKMDGQHTGLWPVNLQWLMKRCWSPFPCARPTFTVVKRVLQDILKGRTAIPEEDHSDLVFKSEELKPEEPHDDKPPSPPRFLSLFRPGRSKRSNTISEPPSFQGLKPEGKNSRARSWGLR